MPFVKGQSGNPSGRPKTTHNGKSISEMAREHTEAALKCLVDVIKDGKAPHSAKVSAASTILERGWGRPKQDVELNANHHVTTEQAGLSEALGWIEAAIGGSEKVTH